MARRKLSAGKLIRCARAVVEATSAGAPSEKWKSAVFDLIVEAERIRIRMYSLDHRLSASELWRDW